MYYVIFYVHQTKSPAPTNCSCVDVKGERERRGKVNQMSRDSRLKVRRTSISVINNWENNRSGYICCRRKEQIEQQARIGPQGDTPKVLVGVVVFPFILCPSSMSMSR